VNDVIVSPRARRDLDEAYACIAADNPQAADRVLDDLVRIFRQLAAGELNGREVTFRNGQRARRWSMPPYLIYYSADAESDHDPAGVPRGAAPARGMRRRDAPTPSSRAACEASQREKMVVAEYVPGYRQ